MENFPIGTLVEVAHEGATVYGQIVNRPVEWTRDDLLPVRTWHGSCLYAAGLTALSPSMAAHVSQVKKLTVPLPVEAQQFLLDLTPRLIEQGVVLATKCEAARKALE